MKDLPNKNHTVLVDNINFLYKNTIILKFFFKVIYSTKTAVEDLIVEELAKEHLTAAKLQNVLDARGKKVSIQAVYDMLRSLVVSGVVLKQSHIYSLSAEWRLRVAEKLQDVQALPEIEPDNSIRVTFNTYVQLDSFWKHINALFTKTHAGHPVFFQVSHEMWVYLQSREASQDLFLRGFNKHGRHGYILVGSKSNFDVLFKQKYRDNLVVEFDLHAPFKRNEHLTVCGSYVVIAKFPLSTSLQVDHAYAQSTDETSLRTTLQDIFEKRETLSITIWNDAAKARRLRKMIARNMYIPMEERTKWDLF